MLTGAGASPQTWIPVARGWVADPADAAAPPSGIIELTGRLLPSEAPLPGTDAGPGRASAVSVAELINIWDISSYPGFVAASSELSGGSDVSAAASGGEVKPLNIGPQPPAGKINWLNLFYAAEWVVFAGFALFIWWRLVKDDYRRGLEDALDEEQEAAAQHVPTLTPPNPRHRNAPHRTPHHRNESAIMIEPQPAVQPQQSTATGTAGGKKRRFGGTEAQIRSALKFYKVLAYMTGTMLLLLCAELIARYAFGQYLFLGGTDAVTGEPFGFGFADAEPPGVIGGVNLSVAVLIVHGWMYVVYLMSNFRLWSLMRWPFMKMIVLALGGVVPFLSFVVEKKFHAEVEAELAANPQAPQRY